MAENVSRAGILMVYIKPVHVHSRTSPVSSLVNLILKKKTTVLPEHSNWHSLACALWNFLMFQSLL